MKYIESLEGFLDEKYSKLLDENIGIVLIRNVNKSVRQKIYDYANMFSNMAAFQIVDPDNGRTHMVLRYKDPIFTKSDFRSIYKKANEAYVDGDYEYCFMQYLKALRSGKSNNLTYAIMGFTLAKLGRYQEAIDYLTIANCMKSNRDLGYNFSNAIDLFSKMNGTISDKKENLLSRSYESVLIDGKIVIVSSLSDNQIERIQKRISDYPGMDCFVVEIDGKKNLIFKETMPIFVPAINTKEITDKAESAYLTGSYDEAIRESKKLILVTRPNSYTFSRLGLAYAKKKEISKAIETLKIAKGLSINENQKLSSGYDSIISDLEEVLENSNYENSPSYDLITEVDSNYVINNFDNISESIANTGLGISDACILLGIKGEALNIMRLLYARKFYSEGQPRIADAFVRIVEASDCETSLTNEIKEEVCSCKNLYPRIKKLSE